MSGDATPSQIERLLVLGAGNYLTNPVEVEPLPSSAPSRKKALLQALLSWLTNNATTLLQSHLSRATMGTQFPLRRLFRNLRKDNENQAVVYPFDLNLRAVGRPETGSSYIGQYPEINCRYLRDRIHGLRAVCRA